MKLLANAAAIVALVFVAVGFIKVWRVGPGSDIAIALFAFPAAIALSFGLYVLQLHGRISALEKRLREQEE